MAGGLRDLIALEDDENHRLPAFRFRIGPARAHTELDFGQLRSEVAIGAGALIGAGCKRGERVAILMPHTPLLFRTFLSCLFVGLVPCVLAWPTAKMDREKYRRNITALVERLRAHHLLTDAATAEGLGAVIGQSRVLNPEALPCGAEACADPQRNGTIFIQFSGGTTGVQKSVPVTEDMLLAQLRRYAECLRLAPDDAVVSWLPLYHDMGLIACLLLPIANRLPLTAFAPMEWVMDPSAFLESIGRDRATLTWLPNFAFSFMATRVRGLSPTADLRSLRAVINCSEPIRAESMDAFAEKFASAGLRRAALQGCYAMAETVFAVTQTNVDTEPERRLVSRAELASGRLVAANTDTKCLVSSGARLPDVELKLVGAEGQPVGPGMVGEILVRSPFLMAGYLDASPETAQQTFLDGWYRTGDLGVLSNDELFVTGRKKDLIIVGGVNVFPEDVEHAVNQVAGIHAGRAVALGIEDSRLGTDRLVVVAEVNTDEDLAAADAIESAIRKAVVAEVGVAPGEVFVVPPHWIVKSTAGKISRSETKARLVDSWPHLTSSGAAARAQPT